MFLKLFLTCSKVREQNKIRSSNDLACSVTRVNLASYYDELMKFKNSIKLSVDCNCIISFIFENIWTRALGGR